MWGWLGLVRFVSSVMLCLCVASLVQAQGASLPQTEAGRVPPKVLVLPEIVLPEGNAPLEVVEVTIVVGVEGDATLEGSDASPEVTAVVAEALLRARFAPATVDGVAVAARVRVRLRVATQAATAEDSPAIAIESPDAGAIATTEPEVPASSYQATGRTKPIPPTARRLEIEEMRDVPGAFGDPFRVLDTLPGVVPVFSGLPYVYVRGAPPASTSYVYDDIAVPLLFHLGILAAIVHPAMLGDLLFYASVAPARYGRKTGGVFGAEGPEGNDDKLHGELELRLIDVSGMLNVPLDNGGRVIGAVRYGYPGLALSLLADDVTLAYWDYQFRVDTPVGARDRFVLTWFGSYDKAGEVGAEITITYHRAEVRLLHDAGKLQLGSALQLGFDQTGVADGFQIQSARFGPRIWMTWTPSTQVRLRVGGDMLATAGEIKSGDNEGQRGGSGPEPDAPGPVPPDDFDDRDNDDPLIGDPISQRVKGRNMIGLYAELTLQPSPLWELGLGVRGDVWITGTEEQHAVEPRVIATYHPTEASDVYAAFGLSYQPAVFPIPIPGLADIVLDNGLQRAIQTEVGYRQDFGDALRLETALFFNHYSGLLFFDTLFDCDGDNDRERCGAGLPRSTSNAYGWELFIKRPSHHRVSGWISYTLGGATATGPTGRRFIPDTDVRHFGSLVVQFDLGANWKLGFRGFFRSGRVASFESTPFNPNQRLPGFARGDVMISNRWRTSWGHMRLALEWFNVTMAREAIGLDCSPTPGGTVDCRTEYAPAIFIPNIGLRGEF